MCECQQYGKSGVPYPSGKCMVCGLPVDLAGAVVTERPRPVRTEPGPDIFRQTAPCVDCPFTRDGVKHGPEKAAAYASYFITQPGASFPCHCSVPKDDDRAAWSAWREGQTLCAGGLIFAEKLGVANAVMQFGAVVKWYDPANLTDQDRVYDSLDEMIADSTPKAAKP